MRSVNFKLAEYTSDIINVDKNIDTCLLFARNLYSVREAKIMLPPLLVFSMKILFLLWKDFLWEIRG